MNNNWVHKYFFGFLKASRIPNLIIIGSTQTATAYCLLDQSVLDIKFFMLVISTMMIAGAGYIINDYYDQKIDMVNRPEKVVIGIEIRRRPALLAHVIISISGILIGIWVSLIVGLVHLFSASLLWYYSNYLRRLPLVGNMTISLLSGLSILLVLLYFRSAHQIAFIYTFFAFMIVLIREVLKDIEGVEGDAAFGVVTVPLIWGIRGAKVIIHLVVFLGSSLLIYFLWTHDNTILRYYFMGLTPLFFWFIYMLIQADTKLEFQRLQLFCDTIILSGLVSMLFH